jgi:heterodisulfide reductase subunit A-like polyferredoxin
VKVKTLLCNCKGLADPFKTSDMNTLPFELESELEVSYAAVHPQLCGPGGQELMADVLESAEDDPDTYVLVCACAVDAQKKLFRKVVRRSGFDEDRLLHMDIRGETNEGILERVRVKVESLANPGKRH